MLVEQRVADLDHAEDEQERERQHEGELEQALAAGAAGRCPDDHSNLPSFFIVESTWRATWPPGKNGRIHGVMNVQV